MSVFVKTEDCRDDGVKARAILKLMRNMPANELKELADWIEAARTEGEEKRSAKRATIHTLLSMADLADDYE